MMQFRGIRVLVLLALTSTAGAQDEIVKVWSAYDFVPGEKVIFFDDFTGEKSGEVPSRWTPLAGNAENAQLGDERVLGFAASMTRVAPRMQTAAYLPPEFTLEFDVYFHGKGNEAYQVDFKDLKHPLEIRGSSLKLGALGGQTSARKPGWQHVALSFNRGALKAYLGETRLVNTPDAGGTPASFSIRALSHGAKAGIPSVMDNVRLAEGAVPLYTKLLADGRFTTRGIHFATGSARLLGNSMGVINEVAKMMQEHPEVNLAIEGHTDSDGIEDMNLKLSQQRAATVREVLITAGIAQGRLTAKGFGESKSVDSNTTAEGKANNRRVEFAKI